MGPARPGCTRRGPTCLLSGLLTFLITTTALPLAAQPAVIYELGGKADRSFNQAAFEGAERW